MYHLRFKGSHYEMGVKRGRMFQRGQISFPLRLVEFQLEHGKRSEAVLRSFFPEVCQEIRGVSDTIGADYLHFASWMLCMGCCMYNLEDNVPVEIRGCTAFAYSRGGRVFMNGEEGLNEHGLAVAMTFVMTDLKKLRAGFNSCFIVRYLLEKADHTEQAMSLLAELPIASNCNILLADSEGRMAVVECTPTAKNIREAEVFEDGRIVCTVNSFTSDEMKPYDDEPDFETVWSSIFDLKSRMVYRAEGDPRRKKFVCDSRLRDVK